MNTQHTVIHQADFTATYSAEDNKLRLYVEYRLEDALYQRVRAMGFKWAPKQELFVAPSWSPAREDFCVELAGTITAEQTTLVDRAQAKAERLEELSEKRARQSNAYANAARAISQHIPFGQPILIGHHSQRRAERDRDKINANMHKAVEASKAVDYWQYRARGVESRANHAGRSDVRQRRIKTLLSDLRGYQRAINHSHKMVKLWEEVDKISLLMSLTWSR